MEMKKLMTVCAACMVAGMAAAQVESQNIVGYNTLDAVPGYNQFTAAFKGVATTDGFNINDISGDTVTGTSLSAADVIQIWDTSGVTPGYNVYFNYLYAGYEQYAGWMTTGATYFDTDYPNGLPAGTAFWYLSRNAAPGALTVAGEVVSDPTTTLTIVPGYNMIANPYPAGLDLDAVVWPAGSKGTSLSTADVVQIWDTTGATPGYNVYFNYLYVGYEQYAGWMTTGASYFADDYPDGVPVGQGFWYLSRGASNFTVDVARPY